MNLCRALSTIHQFPAVWLQIPVSYLDRSQPKGMVVLGKSLVVWYHSPSKTWQCFEDMCPHRLAPLSGETWGAITWVVRGRSVDYPQTALGTNSTG